MPRSLALVALILALATATAAAQDQAAGWNPRTGDAWVDAALGDMNDYGGRYRDAFVDELVRYHGAPRDYVEDLLGEGWAPGDVYQACAVGEAIGRSCRYVAEQWQRHRGDGWGALAQRLGLEPGSAWFRRLKRGIETAYAHWARPLPAPVPPGQAR